MTAAPTIAELVVGADPQRWRAAGFSVASNDVVIGTVTIRIDDDPDAMPGVSQWSLRGAVPPDIDGLPTTASTGDIPDSASHPNGIVAIDHLVVLTPDLDRTIDALAESGLELRRIREGPAGDGREVRQAFFRMAEVILEVVAAGRGDGPARFWGVTFLSDDLEATLAFLGDRVSEPRAAVQPGRRIATIRETVGLGMPVAVMDR